MTILRANMDISGTDPKVVNPEDQANLRCPGGN
jgi:hypothetical protein